MIRNGDFSQGVKGFYTTYTHLLDKLRTEFAFSTAHNPRDVHSDAASFGDHTSGQGLMMVVNGADAVDSVLWGQKVAVKPGSEYRFSLCISSWYPSSPAELEIRVNGKTLGRVVAPGKCGEWKEFQAMWNSGTDGQAVVEIYNLRRAFSGNDFAIDDISLRGPPP